MLNEMRISARKALGCNEVAIHIDGYGRILMGTLILMEPAQARAFAAQLNAAIADMDAASAGNGEELAKLVGAEKE